MSIVTKEKAIKNLSKALFSVVSTDPVRKALNAIHYDGDRIFEATDVHKRPVDGRNPVPATDRTETIKQIDRSTFRPSTFFDTK